MCIFNERVILPSISRHYKEPDNNNELPYLYIRDTPWFLRKQIGSTQMSIVLEGRSHIICHGMPVFHKEEILGFIFYLNFNVYELKQTERKKESVTFYYQQIMLSDPWSFSS